jgi:hypothetical protein
VGEPGGRRDDRRRRGRHVFRPRRIDDRRLRLDMDRLRRRMTRGRPRFVIDRRRRSVNPNRTRARAWFSGRFVDGIGIGAARRPKDRAAKDRKQTRKQAAAGATIASAMPRPVAAAARAAIIAAASVGIAIAAALGVSAALLAILGESRRRAEKERQDEGEFRRARRTKCCRVTHDLTTPTPRSDTRPRPSVAAAPRKVQTAGPAGEKKARISGETRRDAEDAPCRLAQCAK